MKRAMIIAMLMAAACVAHAGETCCPKKKAETNQCTKCECAVKCTCKAGKKCSDTCKCTKTCAKGKDCTGCGCSHLEMLRCFAAG